MKRNLFLLIMTSIILLSSGVMVCAYTSSVNYEAVVDSYTIELDEEAYSTTDLGLYGSYYYSNVSGIYEFFDDDGNYNIIYYLKNNDDQLGWLTLDSSFNKISEKTIEMGLSKFGNAIYYNDHLFVLYGETDNTTTDSSSSDYATTITIEMVKYDMDGNIVATLPLAGYQTSKLTASISTASSSYATYVGYGTRSPFDSGNCDLAVDSDGVIKGIFNKLMYNGHTASSIIFVDSETMEYLNDPSILDSNNKYYSILNKHWTSHSFDERVIAASDGEFVTIEKGDGYPRGFYLTKAYDSSTVRQTLYTYTPFHFREGYDSTYGYNYTFAELGNLVEVSDGYILVAASEKTLSLNYASNTSINESRNIFVQKYSTDLNNKTEETIAMYQTDLREAESVRTDSKNLGSFFLSTGVTDYGVKWLSGYDDTTIMEIRAVAIDNDQVFIIWAEKSLTLNSSNKLTTTGNRNYYYMIIDSDGEIVQEKTVINTATPTNIIDYVYKDGYIYWTNTSSGNVVVNKLSTSNVEEAAYVTIDDEDTITITDGDITSYQLDILTNKKDSITWSSSKTSVATVSDDGLITIVGNGTATITASVDNYTNVSDSITITVDYKIKSVSANDFSVQVDSTTTLIPKFNPTNANVKTMEWTSSDESIFTIYKTSSSDGSVTVKGVSQGTAYLTGKTTDGSNLEVVVKVTSYDAITSFSYDSSSITINKGESSSVEYTIEPVDSIYPLSWYSSDESIATIDSDGVITAVGAGKTTIYTSVRMQKTSSSSTYYVTTNYYLTVNVVVPLESISLTSSASLISKGDTATLTVTPNPTDTTTKYTVTYTSSDKSVATVNSSGVVTAVSDGKAIITATTSTGLTASYTITVGDYMMGDLNQNGKIDLVDILMLIKLKFDKIEKTSYYYTVGDFNGNGSFDLTDILSEIKLYFGKE